MERPAQALDLQGLYEQALTASRQGDFGQALPLWDRFLEQAPEDAAALSNRGNVRLALGDPAGAIADQSASITLAPEEADPHLNRGTAEEALQDWSAAANDYLWILERDREDASALYNLANVVLCSRDEGIDHLLLIVRDAHDRVVTVRLRTDPNKPRGLNLNQHI